MREKLQQLAYGRDDNGCFLKTSERVRDVAGLKGPSPPLVTGGNFEAGSIRCCTRTTARN